MAAPKMLPLLKKARYLIPFIKPITLGFIDPKDELTKELLGVGFDIFGDEAKEKIKDLLTKAPDAATGLLDEHLVRHTGVVLGQLVRRYAKDPAVKKQRADLLKLAKVVPDAWAEFLKSGDAKMSALRRNALNARLAAALSPQDLVPEVEAEAFVEFFRWTGKQKEVTAPYIAGLIPPLVKWIIVNLDQTLLTDLCRETPEANATFKETVLRFHARAQGKLDVLESILHQHGASLGRIEEGQQRHATETKENQSVVIAKLDKIESWQVSSEMRTGLAAYKRSLLAAFKPYQELAIDNFAAAEQSSPDIWDIFVHPACATEHLLPEDMDAAQRETPPRLPALDLLPLLAREDHRRTVLLADPGMGKSTLIQSLVAHLASGRPLSGASALGGLLPVPLILRDLVPLLPQEKVGTWSWDDLLTAFLEKYQRDEAAPALCEAFRDHLPEFRHHLHSSPAVFFLIDGLDEIGDLAKRRQIVLCIQDGFRVVHKDARWLITSRVIGYDDAPLDWLPAIEVEEAEAYELTQRLSNLRDRRGNSNWISPLTEDPDLRENWQKKLSHFQLSEVVGVRTSRSTIFFPLRKRWPMPPEGERGPLNTKAKPDVTVSFRIVQRLHLAPFDDQRQDQFTQRWFQHRHSTDHSRELMREVRGHHHDGVRIISRVPNLLCLINILKRSGKPLPDGRAALYDEIVKAYLGGIDAAYRLRPIHGNSCPFDPTQRRFLLCLLGAHMQQVRVTEDDHVYDESVPDEREQRPGDEEDEENDGASNVVFEDPWTGDADDEEADEGRLGDEPERAPDSDGNLLISRPEIAEVLVPVIELMVNERRVASEHGAAALLEELLHHIASRSGLLIPRSTDAEGQTLFGFTHLSFLEFFAAEWLGREFDRQRNRIVRRSEAAAEDQEISEAELDREFPPLGPVQHQRRDFEHLPAQPAWHEPLIFLLESRKADTATLLRWLFPALHSDKPHVVSEKDKTAEPLMPVEAVRLAVKLSHDLEVPLSPETRRLWWRRLWGAYFDWP